MTVGFLLGLWILHAPAQVTLIPDGPVEKEPLVERRQFLILVILAASGVEISPPAQNGQQGCTCSVVQLLDHRQTAQKQIIDLPITQHVDCCIQIIDLPAQPALQAHQAVHSICVRQFLQRRNRGLVQFTQIALELYA